MADIKFSCPHCQQHIQADTSYSGTQIVCPVCNGSINVPQNLTATAAAVSPPLAPSDSSACPLCSVPLARGAVLCRKCGYNLATGELFARSKSKGEKAISWYKTAYPYVGGLVVILAVLYVLGTANPAAGKAFGYIVISYFVGVHILVSVAAFQEGIGLGFLTLCLPFFAIYYVYKINDNSTLKILYGFALLIRICTWSKL